MALYATHTILDEVRKQLNDLDGKLFTEEEYTDFIEGHLGSESSVTLQQGDTVDTHWRSYCGYPLYKARFVIDPASPLTDATFEYRFNEFNLVYVPTSAETRAAISCTGILVNFSEVMVDIYKALASDAVRGALKASLDGDTYDRSEHYDKMLRMAEQWRGVVLV